MHFFSIPSGPDGRSGNITELFYQPLIHGVMHMPVEHVSFVLAFFIAVVLTVVAHDRIMAEYYFTLIILQFLIMLHPDEAVSFIGIVLMEAVMVPNDQIELAV